MVVDGQSRLVSWIQGVDKGGSPMTALFIRRPVMTMLVMLGILFFGSSAYRKLPVSDLPDGGLSRRSA